MTVHVYIARGSVPAYLRFKRGEGKSEAKIYQKLFYKIGVTTSVDRRLKALQTGCPLVIDIMATMTTSSKLSAMSLEASLHARFLKKRTVGEWFSLHQQQAAALLHLASVWPVGDPIGAIDAELERYRAFTHEEHNKLLRLVVNK